MNIFVHHRTFCASLHVKTCPALLRQALDASCQAMALHSQAITLLSQAMDLLSQALDASCQAMALLSHALERPSRWWVIFLWHLFRGVWSSGFAPSPNVNHGKFREQLPREFGRNVTLLRHLESPSISPEVAPTSFLVLLETLPTSERPTETKSHLFNYHLFLWTKCSYLIRSFPLERTMRVNWLTLLCSQSRIWHFLSFFKHLAFEWRFRSFKVTIMITITTDYCILIDPWCHKLSLYYRMICCYCFRL